MYSPNGFIDSFRAGSYTGYNNFRRTLAEFLLSAILEIDFDEEAHNQIWNNPDQFKGKPFSELINFSDCDGTIGHETSAKLAEDFEKHNKEFKKWVEENIEQHKDFYTDKYQRWEDAFRLAANTGAVMFH